MHIAILGPMHSGDYEDLLDLPPGDRLGPTGAPFIGALARGLLAAGHRLTLVTTDRMLADGPSLQHFGGRIDFHVARARRYATRPNGWSLGKAFDFFAQERRRIGEVLREARPDVVHAHWLYEYALAAQDSGIPALVTIHDSPLDVLRLDKTPYNVLRVLMARRSVRRGPSLAAVSPYIERRILESFGRRVEHVLPNPLPAEAIGRIRARAPERRAASFVFVCNYWSKLKAPDTALRAFAAVRAQHAQARMTCLGRDFGTGGPGQLWAQREGLAEGVEFLGHQPHERALEHVAAATALLHTSKNESFGMAAAEALALGTPVIADANAGALPWLLMEGRAGRLVDTRSVAAVAAAMNAIVEAPAEALEQAALGQRRVLELCDPALLAQRTAAALQSLAAAGGTGVPR